ncbi:MAG: CotH kinase family protein [Candidatus Sumerlaeia bacterium]|nr:CotH kinase family protein [Candidatus Sumerlaeia bacterium]
MDKFSVFKALVVAGAFLVPIAFAQAQDIIVVDDSDGPPTYTETGSWTTTTNQASGYNGTLYRFTRDMNGPATATWRPDFPAGGFYEVEAVFRMATDRTTRAIYEVGHANGVSTREVDQSGVFGGNLGRASLGVHRFTAGTAGFVLLRNSGGAGVYIADAVLFHPVDPVEVGNVRHVPLYPTAQTPIELLASISGVVPISSIHVEWETPDLPAPGMAAAVEVSEGEYRAFLPAQPDGRHIVYTFVVETEHGDIITSDPVEFTVGVAGDFQVIINEVMASNTHTIVDPDFGVAADWVEFYNIGPDVADLSGLAFSDRINNPTKWFFPPGTTIGPNQYLVVWCDNEDFVGEAIHTSFALSASGEDAVLYDPATETILDSISWTDLETDVSLARIPNITGDFVRTVRPTPGGPNILEEQADPPVFSHESGLYTENFSVSISAPDAGEIRYTLDGSHPSPSSTLYTGPIEITGTTSLRARAYQDGLEPSRATSASYFFSSITDRELPILNIVIDQNDLYDSSRGIYVNFNERGREWEREVHVSIASPDGSVVRNVDAGIRIHGGFSRTAPKKSFRLYLRNDYGQTEWDLPWLERSPVENISQLVLRAGGNDAFQVTVANQRREVTYVRDEIIRDWYREQGYMAVDGFFVALYLNGEYWGLYNALERVTADQLDRTFPGNDDYDVVKGGWNSTQRYFTEANNGDMEAWEELLEWHANGDLATDPYFEEFKERFDYQNFMDYFALNVYVQNEDWPHNNWIATRHRTRDDAKWIFHCWDSEWALGLRPNGWTSNTIRWARGDNFHLSPGHNGVIAPLSNIFDGNRFDNGRDRDINGILRHPQGRRDFIIALENVMNFQMVPDKAIDQFNVYIDRIRSEVTREAVRWAGITPVNSTTLVNDWNTAVENLRNFLRNRGATVRAITASEFSLAGNREITFVATGDGSGQLEIRGRVVDLPWSGYFFDGSPIELRAVPADGSNFNGWQGHILSAEEEVLHEATAGQSATVILDFGQGDSGDQWLMY